MTDQTGKRDPIASNETLLSHMGREPSAQFGYVNTPVVRGSTVLFETLGELESGKQRFRYGRPSGPNAKSVEDPITALEGAAGTVLAPSGLAAISTALLSVLNAGDEVLVTDSAYEPTRNFCNNVLNRMGITTRYYDPRIGGEIADLLSSKTRAVFVEAPGSLTFEIQDLPAIAAAVKGRGTKIIADNTWATPLFYKPLSLGADIVVHAGTKMFGGHSDIMLGTISANAETIGAVQDTHRFMGICASPDDCFLAARGLRTLSIRMKEHERRTLEIARWLSEQAGVLRVLHPALPEHPDHEIFKRDFMGSGCLFAVELEARPRSAVAAMLDHMKLFGMGYSWGGFESLMIPAKPNRTAVPWQGEGNLIRLHIGFEDIEDLKRDIAEGLSRYFG